MVNIMKDHERRLLVNELTKVAKSYGHTQQLRSQMLKVVNRWFPLEGPSAPQARP